MRISNLNKLYFNVLHFVSDKMDADTQEGVTNNSKERVSLETNNENRRKGQKVAWSQA